MEEMRKLYFFVDESGDATFFDKKGQCILGREGCSPLLLIGFICTYNPKVIRKSIMDLQKDIVSDEYLKEIPSLKKTRIAFHAKDDVPEVRERVYKVMKQLDFKAEFIVARKKLDIFVGRHKSKENIFYNELVSRLFERKLHKQDNIIYFSKRGNTIKQSHLENALQTAALNFEKKYDVKVATEKEIFIQSPSDEPCLQVVDYMNWAVQRAFIKKEMRYFNFVKEKVSFICDIYDFNKYPKNFYNRNNNFDTKKISPL